MATTTLSTKGQIIIPKEVRDRHGWAPGLALEILEQGDGVVLRPVSRVPATTVDDLLGCLPHAGPPRTLEEMEAGIAEGARRHALAPARPRTQAPAKRPAAAPARKRR